MKWPCRMLEIVALLLATASVAAGQPTPTFGPEDMLQITDFVRGSEPAIAPQGDLVAFSTVDPGDEANIRAIRPTGFLWVAALDGSRHRVGAAADHGEAPAWSPDGRQLAFLHSSAVDTRLAIWDRHTDEVRTIGPSLGTSRPGLPLGSLAPRWTPDGRTVIVPAADPVPPDPPTPRVRIIRSTDPIVPGDARFTDIREWRLVSVNIDDGRHRTLTPDPIALRGFDVAPDGGHILFRAVTPESLGRFRREEMATWIVAAASGDAPRPALPGQKPGWIAFSPDGAELLFVEGGALRAMPVGGGPVRPILDSLPERTRAPLVSAAGRLALLAPRPGTGSTDARMYSIFRPVEDVIVVELPQRTTTVLTAPERQDEIIDVTWSGDGSTLLFLAKDPETFQETIRRWHPGRAQPEVVLAADEALSALSSSVDGRALSFTATTAIRPPDGFVIAADGTRRQVTTLNPQLARFQFSQPEVLSYFSADGEPLQALLYRPDQRARRAPFPVVTYVYEKLTPQKNRFNAEAQLHVSNGFGYLMPDVLVEPGYTGESFVKSVVPAVNAVRATGATNGRFGITGGSFGGYAGLFLISQVNIFAASVVRAPPSDFFSTWADGRDRDVWTIETGQARTGGNPYEIRERYIANSPFFHADRVKTPVLILHGEKDFTVPFQQGEMMFYALRALGRTAEFVIYREGDHSIVRGSRGDFLDVYRRTLEWWARYLLNPSS